MEEPEYNADGIEVITIDEDDSALSKDKQREAKGVGSVTDFVAEKETGDAEKASAAIGSMNNTAKSSGSQAVTIREEDTKLLMDECEISKEAAESRLRAAQGDIKKAIYTYINSPVQN